MKIFLKNLIPFLFMTRLVGPLIMVIKKKFNKISFTKHYNGGIQP